MITKQHLVFSAHAVCRSCRSPIELATPTRANVEQHGLRPSPRACKCGAIFLLLLDCKTLHMHGWN